MEGSSRGKDHPDFGSYSIKKIIQTFPEIEMLFREMAIPLDKKSGKSFAFFCEEQGMDYRDIFAILENPDQSEETCFPDPEVLTILPGYDKNRKRETFKRIDLKKGEVIALCGETGSGKSLLLSDIESLSIGDSPSGRIIEINFTRVSVSGKISPVAQISQNMNYMIDLSVEEFLAGHCDARNIKDKKKVGKEAVKTACKLCGESFTLKTGILSLSGGQSRALMIADALLVSRSKIVLIDEIENAGIDRRKGLEFLLKKDRIILIATHDPLIALMADRRIILKNGGISKVIVKTDPEKDILTRLEKSDEDYQNLRKILRKGNSFNQENFPGFFK